MNITGTTRMSLGATINGRKASDMTLEEREQFAQNWVARHGGSFEWTEDAETSVEPEKPTTDTDKKARETFDALLQKPWPEAMREIYEAVQKAEKFDRLIALSDAEIEAEAWAKYPVEMWEDPFDNKKMDTNAFDRGLYINFASLSRNLALGLIAKEDEGDE